MKKQSDISPFGLRLQEVLRKKLGEKAKSHNRSLNAEITSRLQTSIDAEDTFAAAEAGNPTGQFLAAIETMRKGMDVAEKAMVKLGLETGQLQLMEPTSDYITLSKEQQELWKLINQADEKTVKAIIDLLQTNKGT